MTAWRGFGSDNHAGVHPEVLASIVSANEGHAHAYGADPWTEAATADIQALVGFDTQIAFVWNGTGGNVVGLAASCRTWEAVAPARPHDEHHHLRHTLAQPCPSARESRRSLAGASP